MSPEVQQHKAAPESSGASPELVGQMMNPPAFSLGAAGAPIQAKADPENGMVAIPTQLQGSHDNGCGCDNCGVTQGAAPAVQMKPDSSAPLQLAGGEGELSGQQGGQTQTSTDTIQPSFIGKEFTTSRAATLLSPTNDKNGIPEYQNLQAEIGQNYAITNVVIPVGTKVTLGATGSSKEGRNTVSVAQVTIVSVPENGDQSLVGQSVWTSRSNVSAAAGTDGNFSIIAKGSNIRSAPTAIMGSDSIPSGTKINVVDTRGISEFPTDIRLQDNAARDAYFEDRYMRLYLSVTWLDAQGVAKSGWISANDVAGGFANEVLGTQPVPESSMIDNAPNHKTVGTASAPLLSMGGMVYDVLKVGKNKVRIDPSASVQILKKSSDQQYVQVSSEDGSVVGQWTSISNLNLAKPKKVGEGDAAIDFYPINNAEAYLRTEVQGFAETGTTLTRGDFVETYASNSGKIEVAKVTKVGDNYEPAAQKYWIDPANLADGWSTDIYGTNAAWGMVTVGGATVPMYKGQKEFVNLGGSGGKMKQVSREAYPNLIRMITDAKGNVDAAGAAAPIGIEINSCFRTFFSQKYFKDNENNTDAAGNRTMNDAASPGSSDHQDSNAFDLNNKSDAAVYSWLKVNAWKYDIVQNVNKSNERHHWAYIPGGGVEGQYTTWGTKSNQSW